jgi:hypothetical protein
MHQVVQVEQRNNPRRQRFTVAHETAHLLLQDVDRRSVGLTRTMEERLCDEFAAHLLIPESDLALVFPKRRADFDELLAVCRRYNVSISAALARLGDDYAARRIVIFGAGQRPHPRRPDEVALRAYHARCGDFLIPDLVRLKSLGLGAIEAALAESDTAIGSADVVTLRLWRPGSAPRSGNAEGSALWAARVLRRSGVTLVRVDARELTLQWCAVQNSFLPREAAALAA